MYILYENYISKIKEEQIERYNEKHKNYLIRVGKYREKHKKYDFNQQPIRSIRNNYNYGQQRNRKISNENHLGIEEPVQFNYGKVQTQLRIKEQIKYHSGQRIGTQSNVQPTTSQYNNSNLYQSRQISKNQNQINAIHNKQIPIHSQRVNEMPQQHKNIDLIECPQGCGRSFTQKVLEKHAKVCRKVFQQKRKPFKVKMIDEQVPQVKRKQKQKKTVKPSWREQSELLRNGLQNQREYEKTKNDQKVQKIEKTNPNVIRKNKR